MKSVFVQKAGGPEVIEVHDIPDPVAGPGEIVVRQRAIAVAGAHILIREGRYRFQPDFPVRLGSESAGVVEATGEGVTDIKVGDPVYASWRALKGLGNPGWYGEKIKIPASAALRLPHGIDLENAVAIGLYSAAWSMLAAPGRDYKSALIVGSSGALGICAVELSKLAGRTVIGLVSSPEKAAFVRKHGADHTINYKTENIVERVHELTGGHGVDLILDHLGGPGFTDYFDMLAPWGTIVSINGVNGSPAKDTFEEGRNHAKNCVSICFFAMYTHQEDAETRNRVFNTVMDLIHTGKVKSPVAARFPVTDVRKAHELFESGRALGRVILTA